MAESWVHQPEQGHQQQAAHQGQKAGSSAKAASTAQTLVDADKAEQTREKNRRVLRVTV